MSTHDQTDQSNKTPKIINENHMENCQVYQGDIYGATFPMPGANVYNHIYINGKNISEDKEIQEGPMTSEEFEQMKLEQVKKMGSLFRFADAQLGKDENGNKITNERLAHLLRRCLGLGSHPTDKDRIIMEQLWRLLLIDRPRCPKLPGEQFIRQTFLNIVGYFYANGLIIGQLREIAHVIFEDVDEGTMKNITRGVSSNVFPEGTDDMLDHYIEQLMKGEI